MLLIYYTTAVYTSCTQPLYIITLSHPYSFAMLDIHLKDRKGKKKQNWTENNSYAND